MKVPFKKHSNWVAETQAISALRAVSDHLDSIAGRLLMHVEDESEKFFEQVKDVPRSCVSIDLLSLVMKVTYNPDYLAVLKQYVDNNVGGGTPYTWQSAFVVDNSIMPCHLKKCIVVTDYKYGIAERLEPQAFAQLVSPHSVSKTELVLMYRVERRSTALYISVLVPDNRPDKMIVSIAPSSRPNNRVKFYNDMVAYCITRTQDNYALVNNSNDLTQ